MSALNTIKPENLFLTAEQLRVLMPYFVVLGGTLLAILGCVLRIMNPKWVVFLITVATTIAGVFFSAPLVDSASVLLFSDMMVSDSFSNFFHLVFLGSALFTILASFRYLDQEKLQHPEYYVLLLFSVIGMMFLASSLDMVVIFIALEIMSLSVYMLVAFRRADRRCNEASMKYFILGGAASAIMLYGVALMYGATATTNIRSILEYVQASDGNLSFLFTAGSWLILVGFLFKVASVPFHMWMPDVYEGAPAPITGFMTTGLKAASFAAFVRVFVSLGYGEAIAETFTNYLHDILWICAVLTMVIGNIVALTQTNLKRMLAYSSIAHTGYLLVGMIAGVGSDQGFGSVVLYLVSYAIMNLGAFTVLTMLASRGDEGLNLQDLSGLSKRRPLLSFAMAVFLFSMAGIPPTVGFIGKYMLFFSAVEAGETLLVVISVLCSAVSVYYYLRVLVYMYMRDPVGSIGNERVSIWAAGSVAAMTILTLQFDILPSGIVDVTRRVVENL